MAVPGAAGRDPHLGQPVLTAGVELRAAEAAVIMVHGRGAGAGSVLESVNEDEFEHVCAITLQVPSTHDD